MTALGSRVTMTHRTSILRNAGTGDSWGGAAPDFQEHATDVACRVWFLIDKPLIGAAEDVSVANYHLALPPDTDVAKADRIGPVTFRGATVLPGPAYRIENLIHWPDRIELILRVDG